MDDNEMMNISRKLQTLFNYEKELAKELKKQGNDLDIIKDELSQTRKKVAELETKLQQVEKFAKPSNEINFKDFTPADVYELHYGRKMSIAKIAAYLHCSNGTVINRINQYKKEAGLI